MSHVISERAMQVAYEEIESLRQQLEMAEACLAGDNALIVGLKNDIAEKDAEIARRVTVDEMNAEIECATKAVAVYYENMLAASQAREQQLRDALEEALALNINWSSEAEADTLAYYSEYRTVISMGKRALAVPLDTSAMQTMIAKAGEVMRERCFAIGHSASIDDSIRSLPPITLKDLE